MPKVPKQSSSFEQPPVGNHLAVCFGVIDIGTQMVDYKAGKGPEAHHQIAIFWELPEERLDDGRPHMTSKTYNLSSSEKSNLMKDLQSWRGREFTSEEFGNFEIGHVIGAGCFLNCVEHNNYIKPDSVASLPKGTKAPPLENPRIQIDLDETFDHAAFEGLSEYWKGKIRDSPEYAALTGQGNTITVPEIDDSAADDIPF